MKNLIYSLIVLAFGLPAAGQSRYAFIDFKDAKQPAIVNEYKYSEKVVSGAYTSRLEKLGYKGKESKGYMVYRGVSLPELGAGTYDLFIRVDRKSRKERDESNLTLLVSKGNDVFVSDLDDAMLMANAKNWINKMDSVVIGYDLDLQIREQEELVQSAEKKYRGLVDDGNDLQKKKKRLEDDIDDNTKEQQKQRSEIEKQKNLFEALRAKRRI